MAIKNTDSLVLLLKYLQRILQRFLSSLHPFQSLKVEEKRRKNKQTDCTQTFLNFIERSFCYSQQSRAITSNEPEAVIEQVRNTAT